MKIECFTARRRTLVDGVERFARVDVQKDERGQTAWLGGVEVKARVYLDGVLMVDTTVSLSDLVEPTKRGVSRSSIRDDIYRMTLAARHEGPDTVLRVSQACYEWLTGYATVEDSRTWSPWPNAVLGVEVIIDPSLTGMDYRIAES